MLLNKNSFKEIHFMIDEVGIDWYTYMQASWITQGCDDVEDESVNATLCVLAHQREHSYQSITRLCTTLPSIVFKCYHVKRSDCEPGPQQLVWHPARLDRVSSLFCASGFAQSSSSYIPLSLPFFVPQSSWQPNMWLTQNTLQVLPNVWKKQEIQVFFFSKKEKGGPLAKD